MNPSLVWPFKARCSLSCKSVVYCWVADIMFHDGFSHFFCIKHKAIKWSAWQGWWKIVFSLSDELFIEVIVITKHGELNVSCRGDLATFIAEKCENWWKQTQATRQQTQVATLMSCIFSSAESFHLNKDLCLCSHSFGSDKSLCSLYSFARMKHDSQHASTKLFIKAETTTATAFLKAEEKTFATFVFLSHREKWNMMRRNYYIGSANKEICPASSTGNWKLSARKSVCWSETETFRWTVLRLIKVFNFHRACAAGELCSFPRSS